MMKVKDQVIVIGRVKLGLHAQAVVEHIEPGKYADELYYKVRFNHDNSLGWYILSELEKIEGSI
jgi:hypothetical protein